MLTGKHIPWTAAVWFAGVPEGEAVLPVTACVAQHKPLTSCCSPEVIDLVTPQASRLSFKPAGPTQSISFHFVGDLHTHKLKLFLKKQTNKKQKNFPSSGNCNIIKKGSQQGV